ncbi:hypothetical protein [Neptunomonas japonica]|uniref:Uncharacterized protein n=1 Tax=Neptunomonas japonica JAMM 1380 TaxID=1441457 RepID=A0A7R6SXU5_9GAMM|nr:hypothetical protein [Neptunomonas japonica]BBB31185.1 hypothetical protein NEJAP_3247 [Neptunomonas japonica JAMM 1380]
MIEESIKSIKADLYDRVSSPLMFGFCVAWCVWNYKFLLVLLSDEKVLEKVRIIDEILYKTDYQVLFYGIFYPLCSTLIYIFIYPYPAKIIFSFYKRRQSEIASVKKKIEDYELLSKEESFKIKNKIYELEHEYEKREKIKDDEIKLLNDYIKSRLKISLEDYKKRYLGVVITNDQLDVLKEAKTKARKNIDELFKDNVDKKDKDLIQSDIDFLEISDLIKVNVASGSHKKSIEITPKGRQTILNYTT